LKELSQCIENNTLHNKQEVKSCILNMLCTQDDPIPLEESKLLDALKLEGEFLVLKLHFNDFENELKNEKIKYKISQSLSVIVSYEDDGENFLEIENFIQYIHQISDEKQNCIFGIKKVNKLSEFPITILFSGILPINQLSMRVGKKINNLIHSDDSYFIPRFQKQRDDISKAIGIPILPIFPLLDESLDDYTISLTDLTNGKLISKFEVYEVLNQDTVEIYLQKLFYIYKVLAQG